MTLRPLNDEGREPWSGFELAVAGMTHAGRVRPANQDSFDRFDDPERDEILLVVADGMGGHRGGETASRMAVGTLGRLVREGEGTARERLGAAIARANHEIHALGSRDSRLRGMGTTLVALLLRPTAEGASLVAHVGDSRLYRRREDRFEALTEDHSLVAKMVRDGVLAPEDARDHPRRNQILRALGADAEVEPDFRDVEIADGDVYLLCSDGLNSMLPDEDLGALAGRSPDPHAVVAWMVDAANQAGGRDNVTAMIAALHPA